jgi:hypothetical protein
MASSAGVIEHLALSCSYPRFDTHLTLLGSIAQYRRVTDDLNNALSVECIFYEESGYE